MEQMKYSSMLDVASSNTWNGPHSIVQTLDSPEITTENWAETL